MIADEIKISSGKRIFDKGYYLSKKYSSSANIILEFDDNTLLSELFGDLDIHIRYLEEKLKVEISSRGNQLSIVGNEQNVIDASQILRKMYSRVQKGTGIDLAEIEGLIRMLAHDPALNQDIIIQTRRRSVEPRSPTQADFISAIRNKDMVFGLGPAGSGKTYLAVAMGVSMMLEGKVDRLILSRPAVEAGERLGFLPGDLKDKIDPYLRPLYDALHDMLPSETVNKKVANREIEIAPLAFMRGRTLSNAFVILDEAQNTTPVQMKMFLTRLGPNSRMVITGDTTQIDLPSGTPSGLIDAIRTLKHIPDIEMIHFTSADVVRHPVVSAIVQAYEIQHKKPK